MTDPVTEPTDTPKPANEGMATSIAKTVGGVLGTIAATATGLAGTSNEHRAAARSKKPNNRYAIRAAELKKERRAKHHRKIRRQTKG